MRLLSACFADRALYCLALPLAVVLILLPLASGRATAQAVHLSTIRQNVIFPSTAVGASSSPATVPLMVSRDGITISAISVSTSGGKQEFTIQSIGCALNTVLLSGTVCNARIAFSPGYPGNRSAPLQVETSSGSFYFGMEGIGVGPQVALNPATISTVAGNGSSTLSGDEGPAIKAGVPVPLGTAIDSAGNLFIVDAADGIIREIAANSGTISTVEFSLPYNLNDPSAVAIDSAGNLYIADTENGFIRKVSPVTGDASTFVGTGYFPGKPPMPPQGYAGDGGPATTAELNTPQGVAFDRTDDLYIGDTGNNVIRRVDAVTGIITTVAGNHKAGYSGDGGPAINAELNTPIGVAVDTAGNLFIADLGNNVVRKVSSASGVITTVAGNGTPGYSGDGGPATAAELHSPADVAVDSAGDLYIVDVNNSRIREVAANSGIITTIAGTASPGFAGDGNRATNAKLNYPNAIALDSAGNLYIADSLNNRIRKINVLQSELNFATTPIGFTSLDSPQTATVTNVGNAPLVFSVPASGLNPAVSQNFTLSNSGSCPQLDISSSAESLAPGTSCNLLLNFTPLQTGPIAGAANISDNALSTPPFVQTVHLNAVGLPASAGRPDFSLSVTPPDQTISPGGAAAYNVTITGIYGFTGTVALAVSGLPSGVNATFNSANVVVSGANATSIFTVTIPREQAMSMPTEKSSPGNYIALQYGVLLLIFPVFGIPRQQRLARSVRRKTFFAILLVTSFGAAVSGVTSCANIGLQLQPQTYNVTISGSSGNLQRSSTLVLTVEQYRKIKYH